VICELPEREFVIVRSDVAQSQTPVFETLNQFLTDGYILDPMFNSKPIRLENAVIYHLIKYNQEELEALQAEQEVAEPEIVSVKSVSYEEVDALIAEGYKPRDFYAKNVIMIKIKEPEEVKES
jgi:hypothetical protein